MSFETVIGVEVHVELNTKSKIFCGCPAAFGGEANTRICPVCSGQPGALPALNAEVAVSAVKLGLALSCKIARECGFDRKNYFYPDLPKAYQISQLYSPICKGGATEIETGGLKKVIGIREIHMEEDAGKLIHSPSAAETLIDFNRAGVPLLEIVTEPDFRSGEEVAAFIERLREILNYLEISDCKMQEGSLRVDVNLSLREAGGVLGTRTETKNLNSLRSLLRAVEYETARQARILSAGGAVRQETRRWNEDEGVSHPMRSKEDAQDYRYFPEPDLPALRISDGLVKSIENALPEFAHRKRARLMKEYAVTAAQSEIICKRKETAALFEETAKKCGNPAEAANLICGDISRIANETGTPVEKLRISSGSLACLIGLVTSGKINRGAYRETVEAVILRGAEPEEYLKSRGLFAVSDGALLAEAARQAVAENPAALSDFWSGKEKAFAFLMGQTMKKLSGKGDPAAVKKALSELLGKK